MADRIEDLIDQILADATELKELYVPVPPPPGGDIVYVPAGGDLQAALDSAQGPLEIRLERGATYEGNFRLPVREDAHVVVLRTDGDLPVPKPSRPWITPSEAAGYAKLVARDTQSWVLYTADGAHDYVVDGIEFLPNVRNPERTHVEFGRGDMTALDQVPQRIVVDRCYFHGDDTLGGRRALAFQVAHGAVTRSYFEKFVYELESQAIAIWCGPGPFHIEGNYLEASGENFITGGADTQIQGLIPSDILFRNNYCFKPLEWQSRPGCLVKNLFELKTACRVIVEGNAFENCWTSGQVGTALQLTNRNQDGTNPWTCVNDVTIRYNTIGYCTGFAINLLGEDDLQPSAGSVNMAIHDNVCWACQSGIQSLSPFVPTLIAHNTFLWAAWRNLAFGGDAVHPHGTFAFRDNVVGSTEYGITGDSRAPGLDSLTHFAPGGVYTSNVIEQPPYIPLPPGQMYVPADSCTIDGPYPLGTDGKPCGADVATIRELMPWGKVRARRARWGRRGGDL